MSQTLRKGWLRRLLGGDAQEAVIEVTQSEDPNSMQVLQQVNQAQAAMIQQLKHQLRMATQSQAAMAKRIQKLGDDWPSLFKRYFTKDGDQDRATGKKTRTRRKAKRRTA